MGPLPFRKTLEILLLSLGLLLFFNSFRLLSKPAANAGVEALPHQYKLSYTTIKPSTSVPITVDQNIAPTLITLPPPTSSDNQTAKVDNRASANEHAPTKSHPSNDTAKNISDVVTNKLTDLSKSN